MSKILSFSFCGVGHGRGNGSGLSTIDCRGQTALQTDTHATRRLRPHSETMVSPAQANLLSCLGTPAEPNLQRGASLAEEGIEHLQGLLGL